MPGPFDLSRAQAPQIADAAPLQDHPYGGLDILQAPAHAPVDNQLGELAQSLGQFNGHLEQFGKYWEENQRPNPALKRQDEKAAKAYVDAHTHAEFQAAVKAGTVPRFTSPIANELAQQVNGTYTSEELAQEVSSKLGTGELQPQDAPQYALKRRQEILQQNGWTEKTPQGLGFGRHFNALNESLNNAATAATLKAQNDKFNDSGWSC